jgi:hypothetical protein
LSSLASITSCHDAGTAVSHDARMVGGGWAAVVGAGAVVDMDVRVDCGVFRSDSHALVRASAVAATVRTASIDFEIKPTSSARGFNGELTAITQERAHRHTTASPIGADSGRHQLRSRAATDFARISLSLKPF